MASGKILERRQATADVSRGCPIHAMIAAVTKLPRHKQQRDSQRTRASSQRNGMGICEAATPLRGRRSCTQVTTDTTTLPTSNYNHPKTFRLHRHLPRKAQIRIISSSHKFETYANRVTIHLTRIFNLLSQSISLTPMSFQNEPGTPRQSSCESETHASTHLLARLLEPRQQVIVRDCARHLNQLLIKGNSVLLDSYAGASQTKKMKVYDATCLPLA